MNPLTAHDVSEERKNEKIRFNEIDKKVPGQSGIYEIHTDDGIVESFRVRP